VLNVPASMSFSVSASDKNEPEPPMLLDPLPAVVLVLTSSAHPLSVSESE
jgi:hypothetical protein